jgi:hypothetical protein
VKIDGPRVGGVAGKAGKAISSGAKSVAKAFNGTTAGALVFFDANFNGVLDDFTDDPDAGGYAEPWTFTNHLGEFLPEISEQFDSNANGILDEADGQWVVLGGQYTATGLPVKTVTMTPGDWAMLTPVTTLVTALSSSHSVSVSDAAARIRGAFALPNIDLAVFDPIPEMHAGNLAGAQLYLTHATLTDTASQIMALFPTSDTLPGHDVSRAIIQEMVDHIAGSSAGYDLTDPDVVEALIRGVVLQTGVPIADELITGTATVIATINARIGDIDPISGISVMNAAEPIKSVAQNASVNALTEAAAGQRNITDVVNEFTGDALTSHILAAVIPPTLLVPNPIVTEATDAAGAVTEFLVTATDITGQSLATTLSHETGALFPLGVTTVTASTTDDFGITTTKTFTVTVADTTAPELSVSETLTFEATGPDSVGVAELNSVLTDAVDPNPILAFDVASGMLPVGVTTVTATVSDSFGNSDTFEFDVTVNDTTAPDLTAPADVVVEATGPDGAEVILPNSDVNDLVDPNPTVDYDQSSGLLPVGTTVVTATAIDESGNTQQASFNVTVQGRSAVYDLLSCIRSLSTRGRESYAVAIQSEGLRLPDRRCYVEHSCQGAVLIF